MREVYNMHKMTKPASNCNIYHKERALQAPLPDDIVRAVRGPHDLRGDEDDVEEVPEEEEAEGGELEEAERGVAEVEAVRAEHAQEDGEEQRRLEVVAVRPPALRVPEEGAATGNWPLMKSLFLGVCTADLDQPCSKAGDSTFPQFSSDK